MASPQALLCWSRLALPAAPSVALPGAPPLISQLLSMRSCRRAAQLVAEPGSGAQTRSSPAPVSAGRSDVSMSPSWCFSAAWLSATRHSVIYYFASDFVWTDPTLSSLGCAECKLARTGCGGLPWWAHGGDSACRCGRHGLGPLIPAPRSSRVHAPESPLHRQREQLLT